MSYLEKCNLLSSNQYGFRAHKSTDDAVLQLISKITHYLDLGEKCVGVFLDLQKAFDTVSIPILLSRLENAGVRGTAYDWFADYLSNRKQLVKVDSHESSGASCNYGVPQGSTLGPTLFLIYLNELCEIKLEHAEVLMFADDTVLLFHGSSWVQAQKYAEQGLSRVVAWLENNLLSLNVEKTKYICFKKTQAGKQPNDFKIKAHTHPCNRNRSQTHSNCNCDALKSVVSIKYLGITIDERLNWVPHIQLLSKRIRKLIYVFKTLRPVADQKLLIQTYKALGECVIGYCISSWGGANKTHILEVERAQRALLKVLLALPFRHPTTDLYEKCNVLTVRKLFVASCIQRYHREVVPHQLVTSRRIDKCPVPRCNTSFAQRHYNHLAPVFYNALCKTTTPKEFTKYKIKTTVKAWLQGQNYEEIEKLLIKVI